MQRINLGKAAPELYKTVLELENLSMQKVQQAGLEIGFSHLLKLRGGQPAPGGRCGGSAANA